MARCSISGLCTVGSDGHRALTNGNRDTVSSSVPLRARTRHATPAAHVPGGAYAGGVRGLLIANAGDADAGFVGARFRQVFGICFGHQTAAHALGGSVHRAPAPEIGWYDVDSDVPDVIARGPWMQWHYDVVTVPTGAEVLARTEVGPQAWRMDRTFCTQFHPEATESMLASWSREAGAAELAAIGSSSEQLMADARRYVATSRPHAERLVDWFLDDVN
ncbi:MAG: hypothetical protein HZB15_12435 [Actinobacteria bacterium]|nr:hypothetical protein [Actinomycetota bacterium]